MTRHNFKIVNMPSGFYLSEKEPKKNTKGFKFKIFEYPRIPSW